MGYRDHPTPLVDILQITVLEIVKNFLTPKSTIYQMDSAGNTHFGEIIFKH